MSNLLRKFVFSFLASLLLLFSFAPFFEVKAATPAPSAAPSWYNTDFPTWYGKVYDDKNPSEIFGERYTAAQVQWIIYGLFGFLINTVTGAQNASLIQCFLSNTTDITTCTDKLNAVLKSTPTQNNKRSEAPSLFSLVFATDRPLSGISYVKEKIQNFSLVPVAHAAPGPGFGFNALSPIQSLWRAMRDISFGLFVIAAIVLAFMIMFRVKISPQVVISVQSAIPKIIIALILVTFSYAIAGFLIDAMYVIFGLISLAFGNMGGLISGTPSQVFLFLTQGQAAAGTNNTNWGVFLLGAVYIIAFIIGFLVLLILNIGVLGAFITGAALVGVGSLIGGVVTPLLTLLGPLIVIFIIVVIVTFFLKIIWSLLKAFANIVLLTMFAPLQIAAGLVIPNLGFGSWVKSYVSNLAVFVVTSSLFLFSYIFLAEGWQIGFTQFNVANGAGWLGAIFGIGLVSSFNPVLSSAAWPPLLGGGNAPSSVGLLLMGVSLVLFTLIPKANDIIQSLLSGKPFAYGTAVGEAFGPAYGLSLGPSVEGLRRGYGEASAKETVTTLTTALDKLYARLGIKSGTSGTATPGDGKI